MITAVSVNKRIIGVLIACLVLAAMAWFFWPAARIGKTSELANETSAVTFERLDLALTEGDSLTEDRLATLRVQYGEIWDTYLENIISLCSAKDPDLPKHLNAFLADPYIDTLFSDVQKAYGQTAEIEAELHQALSYFYLLFPKATRYRMIGMVGAFQYKHALTDSALLFGLDLHLGCDYRFYPKVSYLTQYMLPRLEKSHLVADGIKLLVDDVVPPIAKDQVLEEMVRAGKVLFITKKCMPNLNDSILLGFTASQTQWAKDNERNMWEYLIAQNILYSSDPKVIGRLMNDGPFTAGLPEGSPARMAAFTGWRMVERFMDKQPEITIEELLQTAAAELLQKSAYRGK
ncbi:MAG: hypothetical protein C0424_09625 [Sphingobacteriaceae bacterium]|nr:hypothetical protein [Sphingobacteriaceae bacterium]